MACGRAESAGQTAKRGRLWLNDGSCIRLQPEYPGHVWSYDFVADRTHDGRAFRTLNILDEYTRECLAIRVGRTLTSEEVQACLTDLFCTRGEARRKLRQLYEQTGSAAQAARMQQELQNLIAELDRTLQHLELRRSFEQGIGQVLDKGQA